MAFTALTPLTELVESQDAKSFRLFDKSTWTGERGNVTSATLSIVFIDDDENVITYDDVDLKGYGDGEGFDDLISDDGLLVDIANLTIEGVAAGDIFPDGYYEVTVKYNDGSYADEDQPYYTNTTPFLAKYRCMKRTMPAKLLDWPITPVVRQNNYDIYTLGLYLDAAEDAAQLAKKVQFRKFIALIRGLVDYYAIPYPW